METVFSYIVQKRLSQENENVATEALAFVIRASSGARRAVMNLLRSVEPELPDLHFRTQLTDGTARPDLCGLDGATPRVFIENKFWAGLTENQPVEYLKRLASYANNAVLLAVVPEARLETVWREFARRLRDAKVPSVPCGCPSGIHRVEAIEIGPVPIALKLAITSWGKLLTAIEAELHDEPHTRNDLAQLRSLCDVADEEAPFSAAELTNQKLPAFILQLNSVVQSVVELGLTLGVLDVKRLNATHFTYGSGRYMRFASSRNVIAWFGTDFGSWRKHGSTPLWLVFPPHWGIGRLVQPLLEPWARREGITCATKENGDFALAINVVPSEEPDFVVRSIVEQLKNVAAQLANLPESPGVVSSPTGPESIA